MNVSNDCVNYLRRDVMNRLMVYTMLAGLVALSCGNNLDYEVDGVEGLACLSVETDAEGVELDFLERDGKTYVCVQGGDGHE